MRVLGMCQGVKNGFCILQDGKILESGVEDLFQHKAKDNEVLLVNFRKWLSQVIRIEHVDPSHAYDLIVFIESRKSGKAAGELQAQMKKAIEEKVAETHMECLAISPQALKKATLSKGNATKAQMEAWAASKLQRKPTDPLVDDCEVNALALAFYGYQHYNIKGEDPPAK
jgi:hypothetical protein